MKKLFSIICISVCGLYALESYTLPGQENDIPEVEGVHFDDDVSFTLNRETFEKSLLELRARLEQGDFSIQSACYGYKQCVAGHAEDLYEEFCKLEAAMRKKTGFQPDYVYLKMEENHFEGYLSRGDICKKQGKPQAAKSYYESVRKGATTPSYPENCRFILLAQEKLKALET